MATENAQKRGGREPGSASENTITRAVVAAALRWSCPTSSAPRAQLRYLRAVQTCPWPRDQALALVPFYAGARISEIVALDIDDIARSARKGVLRILGKGERVRQVPIHPQLHAALNGWLAERADWPAATDTPPCSSTNAGSASASAAPTPSSPASPRPPAPTTPRPSTPSRHTFATTLVRGGTDLVIVAELLGHARLETTRIYTRPSAEDRIRALDLLPVDK